MSSGINWSTVYNTPVGQLLQDLNPSTFAQLITQETQTQLSTFTNQISQDTAQINAWTTLQSDAQAFSSDLTTLSKGSTFNQLVATSSNSNVASAADQSAQAGSYTISVGSLAQSELDTGSTANMVVTNPNATLTVSGGAALQGSFSIAVGSQSAVTVTLPSGGESLNGLASLINSQPNMGVTASVVQNSQGQWLMEIQANQTGQSITYTDTGTSTQSNGPLYYLGLVGTGTGPLSAANILQTASSAEISFGSTFNASNAISSTSNTFTNLIPGLTVTAQSLGTTTINVSPNISAMQSSVQQFVSDWNQWVKDTGNLAEAGTVTAAGTGASTTYSYQANSHQVLTSGLPMSIINEVQQIMGLTTNGLTGAYQSLGDIGLSFSANGTISVNSGTLSQALSTDPSAVQSIFANLNNALGSTSTTTGIVAGFELGSTSTAGEGIATLNQQVSQDQSRISLLKQQMTAQEQQAIVQYGQWVNQVSKDSEQYSLLNALFNPNGNSSSSGG